MTKSKFSSALHSLYSEHAPSILDISTMILRNPKSSHCVDEETRASIRKCVERVCRATSAPQVTNDISLDLLQSLSIIYKALLTQMQPFAKTIPSGVSLALLWDIAQPIERWMLGALKRRVAIFDCLDARSGLDKFVGSVRQIIDTHQASKHPFYETTLPDKCSTEDLSFYLYQESTLDPYFDDLLANLQVGVCQQAKAEIGENYYDEIGRGSVTQAHSYLFARCAQALASRVKLNHQLLPEALLCGNLSVCLSMHREYYPIAIGYFGTTEELTPKRFLAFLRGWTRCGLPSEDSEYQRQHVEVDVQHADGWWRNVAFPPSARSSLFRRSVELGISLRLETSVQYLDAISCNLSLSVDAETN